MHKIIFGLAVAAVASTSTPASAQAWRLTQNVQNEIRQDMNQLNTRISRAQQRGTVNRREAQSLRGQANEVRQLYARYSRNGLSRAEVTALERKINQVHRQLRLSIRNWDGRR